MTKLSAASLEKLRCRLGMGLIVGPSQAFEQVLARVHQVAGYDVTVLITGETGSGKEVVARAVHYLSDRADKPFVPVNCGAIPQDLLENELFGHERGSYTGAHAGQRGLVRQAEGGTLFLDEIDSLSAKAQVKLLRFLQNGEYRPIGSGRLYFADARVLAASNQNLTQAVKNGELRSDLFYRLNVVPVRLPALRRRMEDIPCLAEFFLKRAAKQFGKGKLSLDDPALELLSQYRWPGNIRELEQVIQRAALLCEGGQVMKEDLELEGPVEEPREPFQIAKAKVVARFERDYLVSVLAAHGGNITEAARSSGKHRRVFFELVRKHEIDVARFRRKVG